MPTLLEKGRYRARLAVAPGDVETAQGLRGLAFRGSQAARDRDRYDAAFSHVLLEDTARGTPVGCFRYLVLRNGSDIHKSYASQFYELSKLSRFPAPMAEIGRFCLHPERHDPDILRLAWGAITALVDREGIALLFGCASFPGTDPHAYRDAFALLAAAHLAPERWGPGERARPALNLADVACSDRRRGLAQMPPLLRTYLAMGGWVSRHAVIDTELNTLHVFTGLEIAAIPAGRARLLRALAHDRGGARRAVAATRGHRA